MTLPEYPEQESEVVRHNRALDILIESIYKPDSRLRNCARNQNCYNELMRIRERVIAYLNEDYRLDEK